MLPIDGGSPVWRERVYCYELYHQLRCKWPDDSPFVLNGEVDKGGHPILRQLEADSYKPDFLVHIPGNMDGNSVVVEVKPCNAKAKSIKKDLNTLHVFTTAVGYRRGIYLIYGGDCGKVLERVTRTMVELEVCERVEVWTHQAVGASAVRQI